MTIHPIYMHGTHQPKSSELAETLTNHEWVWEMCTGTLLKDYSCVLILHMHKLLKPKLKTVWDTASRLSLMTPLACGRVSVHPYFQLKC